MNETEAESDSNRQKYNYDKKKKNNPVHHQIDKLLINQTIKRKTTKNLNMDSLTTTSK